MFDAFNEPYSRYNSNGRLRPDLGVLARRRLPGAGRRRRPGAARSRGSACRRSSARSATGATQPILLAGRDYANDLDGWTANRPVTTSCRRLPQLRRLAVQQGAAGTPRSRRSPQQVPVVTAEMAAADCKATHVERVHEVGGRPRRGLPDLGLVALARPQLHLAGGDPPTVKGTPRAAERHGAQGPPGQARAARVARRRAVARRWTGAIELGVPLPTRCWVSPSGRVLQAGGPSA